MSRKKSLFVCGAPGPSFLTTPSRATLAVVRNYQDIIGFPATKDLSSMSDCQPSPFVRGFVRQDSRLLIESTCARCGEMRIVSHSDGSLERWEQQHECDPDKRSIRLVPAS